MLKQNEGFDSIVLMKSDGIVIRWEGMDYKRALHYSSTVLSLVNKANAFTQELLDPTENQLQSLRLNCYDFKSKNKHEVIVSQVNQYLMLCIQKEIKHVEEETVEKGEEAEA
jgi:hypothetical protein